MPIKADAVVIGAGISGVSAAYELASRGLQTVFVIEAYEKGGASTRRSAAMVMHQTGNEDLTQLAKISIALYEEFAADPANDFDFRRIGSLLYASTAPGMSKLVRQAGFQRMLGVPTQEWSPDDIFERTGGFLAGGELAGGIYCADDVVVDPYKLVTMYISLGERLGVRVDEKKVATGIRLSNGRVRSVSYHDAATGLNDEIRTDIVVNSAGAWAPHVAAMVGRRVPIINSMRTLTLLNARPGVAADLPIMEDAELGWYFREFSVRHGKVEFLVGVHPPRLVPNDEIIFEPAAAPDIPALRDYLEMYAPLLNPVDPNGYSSWSGYRPLTPDGLPVIGAARDVPGFYYSCGWGEFGVTLGAIGGVLTAQSVLDEKPLVDTDRFSPDRAKLEAHTEKSGASGVAPRKPPQFFGWSVHNGRISLDALDVATLAKETGPPLYIYSGAIIEERVAQFRRRFREFELLYSIKSNPNAKVCKLIADLGLGAGISSPAELSLALEAGFAPSDLSYVGPGKRADDLEQAVRAGIGMINIESSREFALTRDIGRTLGQDIPVCLRINTRHRPSSAGELMAGVASQFGIDEEVVVEEIGHLLGEGAQIYGIHTFVASQVLDHESLIEHFEKVASFAVSLSQELGFELRMVNFGGGFGVTYSTSDEPLSMDDLAAAASQRTKRIFEEANVNPRLVIEVGRQLVAESGLFLTEVIEVKSSRGIKFVIVGSGISGFSRPAMSWGQQHPCSIVTKVNQEPTGTYRVVGRSCMPADVLCESVDLPDPQPGDIIAVHNAGAYGRSMSLLGWGSFDVPKEVMIPGSAVPAEL